MVMFWAMIVLLWGELTVHTIYIPDFLVINTSYIIKNYANCIVADGEHMVAILLSFK